MVDLVAQSPLQDHWADNYPARIQRTGLDVRENPGRLKYLLATDGTSDVLRAVTTSLGAPLPATAKDITGDDPCCIRLAPNRWLICYERSHGLGERLIRTTAALQASVNDVSDGWLSIDIAGPLAYALLVRGCELDLHQRAFGKGRFAATQIAAIDVLIHLRVHADSYEVLVDRSLAADLWMWLKDRAKELTE
ncbi:sarcosine oxidase subunit gamma family protein [Iodidimonas sp. SYSU 1G8]|uniref:sarcosine oxidase subunit gamma n=1 Tax=Iodidimonas sp. SYSU 1G8 TaxID=3133967 RepID=UPI0031FEAB8F